MSEHIAGKAGASASISSGAAVDDDAGALVGTAVGATAGRAVGAVADADIARRSERTSGSPLLSMLTEKVASTGVACIDDGGSEPVTLKCMVLAAVIVGDEGSGPVKLNCIVSTAVIVVVPLLVHMAE